MEEKTKIYGTLEDGTKTEYDVIVTFKNNENQKDYIVYTDNSIDENGKLKMYAAVYDPYKNEIIGNPETDDEWEMINGVIDDITKEN